MKYVPPNVRGIYKEILDAHVEEFKQLCISELNVDFDYYRKESEKLYKFKIIRAKLFLLSVKLYLKRIIKQ